MHLNKKTGPDPRLQEAFSGSSAQPMAIAVELFFIANLKLACLAGWLAGWLAGSCACLPACLVFWLPACQACQASLHPFILLPLMCKMNGGCKRGMQGNTEAQEVKPSYATNN